MDRASEGLLRGRYRLGRVLGEGATGTVRLAADALLGREVAVKILKPAYAGDATLVARFYAEARAAAALVDPHVVGVYDVLAEDDLHAIVMEFVDGPSLAAVLRANGPLGEARAVAYGRQIAGALAAAHARGLLHRDIKPANLLLAPGDTIKVADFGLAKALAGTDPALTEAGRLIGSAAYFSPEQAQGQPLGPASDLYSLGVVLYQFVTGRLPFAADSPLGFAVAHASTPAPAEAALAQTMSPGLAAIVHRLLQKDPAARFASAAALETALATLARQPAGAPPAWDAPTLVSTMPIVPPRTPARARTAPAMLAAGIAALLVLLGVGWGARRPQAGPAFAAAPHAAAPQAAAPHAARAAAAKLGLVTVPNLRGMDYAAASRAMRRRALRPSFAARISDASAESVLAQYPAAGSQVRPGTTALVIISTGPRPALDLRGGSAYLKLPPGHRRHQPSGGGDQGDGEGGD